MLIPLFCMFDDYWRIHCWSQDSARKRTVKTPYFWRSAILGKYLEVPIWPEDGSSQKERARWATRGPHHPLAWASPRPRRQVVWPPWPISANAPSCILSPRKPKTVERFANRLHRLCGAENTHREKALRQVEICQENSFLEGGNCCHRHRHRPGFHRDHHHHHHHQHLHHRHHHVVPL
jgi:hypothetical protein